MSINDNIGGKIKNFRQKLGLQAKKLAEQLNISPSYLNLIESGKRNIDGGLLLKICNELRIELSDLTSEKEISLDEFAQGKEINIRPHLDRNHSLEASILRAGLRLGEAQYHILHNNCEHFVEWCISGLHQSNQSTRGKIIYSAGMGARALWGAKNPIGFVAGAAAGYAYIHHQGKKQIPDLEQLEIEFERIMETKSLLINE